MTKYGNLMSSVVQSSGNQNRKTFQADGLYKVTSKAAGKARFLFSFLIILL